MYIRGGEERSKISQLFASYLQQESKMAMGFNPCYLPHQSEASTYRAGSPHQVYMCIGQTLEAGSVREALTRRRTPFFVTHYMLNIIIPTVYNPAHVYTWWSLCFPDRIGFSLSLFLFLSLHFFLFLVDDTSVSGTFDSHGGPLPIKVQHIVPLSRALNVPKCMIYCLALTENAIRILTIF